MKFKDVKEHTWVKYLGDYFFVGYVDDYECYLENELDVITQLMILKRTISNRLRFLHSNRETKFWLLVK